MRLACPNQLSPTQNLLGNGMQLSARNAAAGSYLPSDNPTSLIAWFRMGIGVTESGGFASAWADQSGNGNDLLQASGTNQPAYSAGVLTFDGIDNWMKTLQIVAFGQPAQFSVLLSQISWNGASAPRDILFSSWSVVAQVNQFGTTPGIVMNGGAASSESSDASLGVFTPITCIFSGASSVFKVGSAANITGNFGANSPQGFTLGSIASGAGNWSNIAVKEIIIRNVNDSAIYDADHAYLMTL